MMESAERSKHSQLAPIHLESNFYEKASSLHAEFEEKLLNTTQTNAGMTPFTYVYSEDKYQFLTVSAEQVFTQAILGDLIDRISTWAAKSLDTFHVSTPQVRLFIAGCRRHLVRDNINVPWHYLLSLTVNWPRGSCIKVFQGSNAENQSSVAQIVKSELAFNQFVVHNAEDAYGIDFSGKVMDPMRGIVLLDGYLW